MVRVRPAHRDYLGSEMRAEEWLLIEWPEGEAEPTKYVLTTALEEATLSIAAYGFLMAQRLKAGGDIGGRKTRPNAKCLPLPKITSLVGVLRAQRHVADSITIAAPVLGRRTRARPGSLPSLQVGQPKIEFMTQYG